MKSDMNRRAGGGSIINTASFVAILGAATPQLAYTASKGGVLCEYSNYYYSIIKLNFSLLNSLFLCTIYIN